jgi:hypothetical protein
MEKLPPLLRRREASEYLFLHHGVTVAPATLAKYACIGGGPKYRSFNRRPIYHPEDLDAWVGERLTPLRRSTSDIAPLNPIGEKVNG